MRRDPVNDLLSSAPHLGALQRLASARPHLSGAEQAIATFILEQPHALDSMSAAQLAATAGVSEATVFRLCRELGFVGYTDLRDQVTAAAERFDPSFLEPVQLAERFQPLGRMHSFAHDAIRSLIDALSITDHEIDQAADIIHASRRVIISGVGGYTARIAEMAAFGLQRVGITCMLWLDTQAEQVTPNMFTPYDAVIGISYSGNNRGVAGLLEKASHAGAKCLSVTNYRFSPVAKQSHIALVTSFRESQIQNFDLLPRIPQLLVVQALIDAVRERVEAQRRGEELPQNRVSS